MIFSKKNHDIIRQNDKVVKKPHKHDANLQKNSALYFQVGLILCLLCAYGLLEMKFYKSEIVIPEFTMVEEPQTEFTMDKYEIYKKPVEKVVELPKKEPKNPEEFDVRENDSDVKETASQVFTEDSPNTDKALDPGDIDVPKEPEEFNIMLVEQVPIFPGCENAISNDARRQCMSDKMGKFIQKKFDTRKGTNLGLSGVQKIYVNFKINKFGDIEILETSAPHDNLAKEANRVINKLPSMIPGQHGNKKVDVLYTIPIIFQIRN
ncbi:energy transducer TonB [Hanstruepera marina]|uniref:energy transducer TonB n=1 Tax=Hanstruepera marina TaxID=2873265 RepID=UPI001CA6F505|nr:energy transducer TonB [Hanstruepera marina]